ncbi:MAG TPA: hypothetical protein VGH76_03710 [Actinomycetospora sp.]|uniref:hypothetical protein n=1 Tax=Actinomycetospora sp. TaxID=1872135 RepID=UPI002F424D2F
MRHRTLERAAHWNGLFALGAPDGVVVNVTEDAIWIRLARRRQPAPLSTPDEIRAAFGDEPRTVPAPRSRAEDLVDEQTLTRVIPDDEFVPPGVDRIRRHEFPPDLVGTAAPLPTTAPSTATRHGERARGSRRRAQTERRAPSVD